MAIPAFGLGTFRLKDDVVIASVKTALETGLPYDRYRPDL